MTKQYVAPHGGICRVVNVADLAHAEAIYACGFAHHPYVREMGDPVKVSLTTAEGLVRHAQRRGLKVYGELFDADLYISPLFKAVLAGLVGALAVS